MMRSGLYVFATIAATLAISVAGGLWWIFSPAHAFQIYYHDAGGVRLIDDTPEVRRLITIEGAHSGEELRTGEALLRSSGAMAIVERRRHAERYFPEHVKFVNTMAVQKSILVEDRSYVRLLERSSAKCEPDLSLSPEYARVRISNGPQRGHEGWLCYFRDIAPTIESP